MKELILKTLSGNLRRFLSFSALSLVFTGLLVVGLSCVQGTGDQSSDDPINTGIIAFLFFPEIIFGNGQSETEIQASTEIFPPGSPIDFEITGGNLKQALRGCLFNEDSVLDNNGHAFVDYVGGINIASSTELLSDEPPLGTVNIAATVMPPGGDSETDFETILLQPVGMIPPEDTELTSGEMGGPAIFLTLVFQTIGLPPGTIVDFEVFNAAIGSVSPASDAVVGSEDSGSVTTQYTSFNETGGAQRVIARAVLPNPITINPSCPNVAESDRTVEEFVIITQSAPDAEPTPTPQAEICNNQTDDDGDGLTDCQDSPTCDGVPCNGVGGVCPDGGGACS